MAAQIIMLLVFFGVMTGVGIYCRRHTSNVDAFVLGGRKVGPWLTAFAYGTSYFSAVVFVGYAGQFGWKYGIAATWIGLGNALIGSLMAWRILGRRTRILSRHLKTATMPEFFGKRYESEALKVVASLLIFVFLIPYTASLYNGLSRLFEMAFHMDYTICILIMAVLTGIYVIVGGYMATAINDFIQGLIMLGGIVAVVAAVLRSHGGFAQALDQLARMEDAAVSTQPGVFASFFGPDPWNLLGVVVLTSLGTWGLPQMVQKFYAIKDEKAIGKGTVISSLFALVVSGGCYFLGGFGRLYQGSVDVAAEGYDAIIPYMISRLSPVLIGVVIVLVLAASMSTLSSLVLTSSSTLTLDLLKGHVIKDMDEKRQLRSMRVLILVFIAISAAIAIFQYRSSVTFIAQLMGVSWGALAGAFLGPFVYGLYWEKTSKAAVAASFFFATALMLVNLFAKTWLPAFLRSPLNAGAFAMIAGLILVPVVSLLTPGSRPKTVEEQFACYQANAVVPQVVAMEETAEKE